ncbi:MAG: hypothetical protein HY862_09505 [Chloroflexi bacterium]|nr:hypothetical protein [Chloroflexota bacterium]
MNRMLGIILLVVGVLIGIIAAAWLFTNNDLETPAKILGLGLALLILVAPLTGAGIYLTAFGQKEAKSQAEASLQRKLLNVVQTSGEIRVNELAVELQLPPEQVKSMIYQLVGLGVYSGYINWEKGVLYSSDASKLRAMKQCPNCGSDLQLGGKGVVKCPACGTEFFLS